MLYLNHGYHLKLRQSILRDPIKIKCRPLKIRKLRAVAKINHISLKAMRFSYAVAVSLLTSIFPLQNLYLVFVWNRRVPYSLFSKTNYRYSSIDKYKYWNN